MLVDKNLVFLDKEFNSKDEVLLFMSEQVYEQGNSNGVEQVYQALIDRELQSTTGMLDGFAIPHAKSDNIIKPCIVVVRNKKELDWESLDGQPITVVLGLFVPEENQGTDYLKALSSVSKMLMKDNYKIALKEVSTADEIVNLIEEQF